MSSYCHCITLALKGLSTVHTFGVHSDPALVLAHNSDHASLINFREFNLIPGVLHEPQVIRDLPLIHALLDCVFSEDLQRILEVLVLIS